MFLYKIKVKLSTRQSVLAYKQVLKGLGPLKSLNYLRLKTNQVNQMVPEIFDLNKRSSSDEGKENLNAADEYSSDNFSYRDFFLYGDFFNQFLIS